MDSEQLHFLFNQINNISSKSLLLKSLKISDKNSSSSVFSCVKVKFVGPCNKNSSGSEFQHFCHHCRATKINSSSSVASTDFVILVGPNINSSGSVFS